MKAFMTLLCANYMKLYMNWDGGMVDILNLRFAVSSSQSCL
jgi:hypothetical protein